MTPAFERSFTQANIKAGFEKPGIYPLNRNAISPEQTAPSRFTDKPLLAEPLPLEEIRIEEDFDLSIPHVDIAINTDPLHNN